MYGVYTFPGLVYALPGTTPLVLLPSSLLNMKPCMISKLANNITTTQHIIGEILQHSLGADRGGGQAEGSSDAPRQDAYLVSLTALLCMGKVCALSVTSTPLPAPDPSPCGVSLTMFSFAL